METTGKTPEHIRHIYELDRELKSYSIYRIVEIQGKQNQLTDCIRIEEYHNKSNASGIKEYLRLRSAKSWKNSEKVTGLRPAGKHDVFYGDRVKPQQKKSLIIFTFSPDGQRLILDVFPEFYPNHKGILQNIITAHRPN